MVSTLVGSSPAGAASVMVPCSGVPAADGAALLAAVNAHASGDTVVLVGGCNYQLAGVGFNNINDTFTLQGNGATITSSADMGGGSVFIQGTTPASNLTIRDVTFSGIHCSACDGPVVFNGGSTPTLTVIDSTLTGNTGRLGGAISLEASGSATIVGSTFVNNTATELGGDGGGAILNDQTVTVINSTFTGNTADTGGAFANVSATATFVNDTIAGNTTTGVGSGAYDGQPDHALPVSTATMKNTIISNNVAGNCAPAAVTDGGFNLENGSSCHFANHAVSAAPALGALANNGGPTQTMAITTASPAFDTASLAVCSAVTPSGAGGVDQRGVSRTPTATETACDIGAFEVQPAAPPVIVMPRFTG
jgi:hypothetical protein